MNSSHHTETSGQHTFPWLSLDLKTVKGRGLIRALVALGPDTTRPVLLRTSTNRSRPSPAQIGGRPLWPTPWQDAVPGHTASPSAITRQSQHGPPLSDGRNPHHIPRRHE